MVTLVTGGSGSGKSAFAEQEIVRLGKRRRIYIATMKPWDEAVSYTHLARNLPPIQRFRDMRKGFTCGFFPPARPYPPAKTSE